MGFFTTTAAAGLFSLTGFFTQACDPPLPTTVIVGDSVGWYAKDAATPNMNSCGWSPIVDAVPGRQMADWATVNGNSVNPAFDAIAWWKSQGATPEAWIIEIGTNDARLGHLTYEWAQLMIYHVEVNLLPGERVIWTNLNIGPNPDPWLAYRASIWNQALVASGVEIADWAGVGSANLFDGVHPNPTGVNQLTHVWCHKLNNP